MSPLPVGANVKHRRQELGIGEVLRSEEKAGCIEHHVYFPDGQRALWFPETDLETARSVEDRFLDGDFEPRTRPFDVRSLGAAMRWANATTGELLITKVDPLPHQVLLTHRVVASEPTRRLVADDVGLGKTIEAGMIISALRCRGRAGRVLIVVPAGLVAQWIEEMEEKFNIVLAVLGSENLPSTRLQWDSLQNVVVSMDFLKAKLDKVKDSGYWDVVVFDEAHRLSRTFTNVSQRHRLAAELLDSGRCGAAILLTATPHQGNNERFVNLLRLVRPDLQPDILRLQADSRLINQIMVRNRKLDVTDEDGRFIFDPPPEVQTHGVNRDETMKAFQKVLDKYLRRSFEQATVGGLRGRAIGFVMTTYAKLASSSPRAIVGALERRRSRLMGIRDAEARPLDLEDERFEGEWEESIGLAEREGAGQFFEGELAELERVIVKARECERSDEKLKRFLRVVQGLLEANPEERFLVFTEYRGTQTYISNALRAEFPNFELVEINGGMDLTAKRRAVTAFNSTAAFMVSTEAGGEGINLQERCHIVVNYDLPWNPMRLRQRVGRLYRYGQEKQVIVLNLRTDGAADELILSHLESKIEQVVRDLAQLDGDKEENLRDDILGQTIAEFNIETLVMQVHKGSTIDRVKADVDVHMRNVAESAHLQKDLFSGVSAFKLADYEEIRCPFGPSDVSRFVLGAVRELGGTARESETISGVLSLVLPARVLDARRGFKRDYESISSDRRVVRTNHGVEQFLFGHPAFDAVVDAVLGRNFGGEVVRRHVTQAVVPLEGNFFEFHFNVAWLSDGGGTPVEEFVVVLVDPDGRVVDAPWIRSVVYVESSGRSVRWSPDRDEKVRAIAEARRFVASRKERWIAGRRPQPPTLNAAALLVVNG